MPTWLNNDGLFVKFGVDEGDVIKGGQVRPSSDIYTFKAVIDNTDARSATYQIVGAADALSDGSFGVVLPKGIRIKGIEIVTLTAFTSSGTIGSSTFSLGLKQASDRSTELDHDGFTTASFVGSALDAAGERTYVTIGSTGAGALIGTTLASNGILVVANTAHATHPFTAGRAQVNIEAFYP